MNKIKGLRPNEFIQEMTIYDELRKAFPMEYRNSKKIYVMLLCNGYLQQDNKGFLHLTEKGYCYLAEEKDIRIPVFLDALIPMHKDRLSLFYELWEYIGTDENSENPYYVKGSDFYNTIKNGIEGLPPTYSQYISALPNKTNGAQPARLDWYRDLFMRLADDQVQPFLARLSALINTRLNHVKSEEYDCKDILKPTELSKMETAKNTFLTKEQKLIQKLISKTEDFVIEWKTDNYVSECIYSDVLYRVWMEVKPYSESHEYLCYGLDVFHEKWKRIAYEEEDPETTELSETGKMLYSLYSIATSDKYSERKPEYIIKERNPECITKERNTKMELGNIFIVHGHNDTIRTEVELFVTKLGFKAIVLFKEPSKGNTIIEKIEAESESACYCIVLYTACDFGRAKEEEKENPRARQNVVFEHGYMCALLGRQNVCALVEQGVEIPGDLSGFVYIEYDEKGAWKVKIAKEMQAAGLDVDLNKLQL